MTGPTMTDRWNAVMMENYGTPPIAIVSGRGAWVVDDADREYLDFVAGIAVNALGHAHPALVEAIGTQAATLGHTSNLAIHEPGVRLAERLVALADPSGTRGGRVFFCNSGAEANEAAFKLSRLSGKTKVIAMEGGFHGRTMGALALTGQPGKSDPFRPLPGEVVFVPFGDVEALESAIDEHTAAVFVEPIQGEGGVVTTAPGYLEQVQRITHAAGALFVVDEVQTGIGRTGSWFAFQHEDVQPDVITLAKGLAGGVPIGAVIAFGSSATAFQPGSHGSTFGGNPFSTAAANAVLDVIEQEELIARAATLHAAIAGVVAQMPHVSQVRGKGLMIGIVLDADNAKDVEVACREAGVLVNAPAPNVIRIVPPLVTTDDDVSRFLATFGQVLEGM